MFCPHKVKITKSEQPLTSSTENDLQAGLTKGAAHKDFISQNEPESKSKIYLHERTEAETVEAVVQYAKQGEDIEQSSVQTAEAAKGETKYSTRDDGRISPDAKQSVKLMPLLTSADNDTVYYLSLLGGYIDNGSFVPIRFGIKQSAMGKNYLYVVIDNVAIKIAEVSAEPHIVNDRRTPTDSAEISITMVLRKVNNPDILRYVPDFSRRGGTA